MDIENYSLSPGCRLELLVTAFKGSVLRPLLDTLDTKELVEAHNFLWDKLVEMFYSTQRGEFERSKVTARMMSSAHYQKEQGCDLRLDYCKGIECVWSNPECAGNKIKNNMEVMAKVINSYVEGAYPQKPVFQSGSVNRDKVISDLL